MIVLKIGFVLLSLLTLYPGALMAQTTKTASYPPPPPQSSVKFGTHLQRTMALLQNSTPTHHNKVKILFYGQSITKQTWWQNVADDLRRRFPNADLTIENRAIGGFASNLLIRTAEHDLYPFYPDLVIFHDYGGEPDYESIIAKLRRTTTSEVILQTDHVTWMPNGKTDSTEDLRTYNWHNQHGDTWLPAIADKYGCELADIRNPWRQYLQLNSLPPQALLVDGVHLNDQGNYLMAELIKPHLHYDFFYADQLDPNLVRDYAVGKDVLWKDGKLTLDFEGNRIDVIADKPTTDVKHLAHADVRIDGKKPSAFPELYAITRPNDKPGVDWPWNVGAIIHVSAQQPLQAEEWTARITSIGADGVLHFDVIGSKTGPDGSGASNAKFVSKSGRVVIEPQDWWTKDVQDRPLFKVGSTVTWQVRPLFEETYQPFVTGDFETRELTRTLAQGLANGKHTLELKRVGSGECPIRAIRVYQPPVK